MTNKSYKPINVPKGAWERYNSVAIIIGLNIGTSLSIPKMLDMAVTLLEKEYDITRNV